MVTDGCLPEEDEEDWEDDPGEVLRCHVLAQVRVQPQPGCIKVQQLTETKVGNS